MIATRTNRDAELCCIITLMRFILSLVILLPLCAQPPQEPQKKVPPPLKNLKVLQPEEVRNTMFGMRASLGVMCTHCHIQGDNASDENPKKLIARFMMTMVREINVKFPDGKEHVTCYTCHRGKTTPEMAPPPAPPAQ